jgi:hypothetical protein
MGAGTGPAQIQASAFDTLGGEGPFHRRHIALDPAAKATGWAQQQHPVGHAKFLSVGFISSASLRVANIKVKGTM